MRESEDRAKYSQFGWMAFGWLSVIILFFHIALIGLMALDPEMYNGIEPGPRKPPYLYVVPVLVFFVSCWLWLVISLVRRKLNKIPKVAIIHFDIALLVLWLGMAFSWW